MRRQFLSALVVTGAVWAGQPPKAGLSVARPILHYRQEEGPAIAAGYEYQSGEILHLSFRISGYRVVNDRVNVRWQLVAVDPEGLLLAPPVNGEIKEELSFNDKDWMPKAAHSLALPAQLPPGSYKLKIQISDENAQASADQEVSFRVGGQAFPKADVLSVLDLSFYRKETDRQRMEPAVYHTGDTLLAKFRVAGYQLGAKNRFEVSYGLSVLDEAGKVLYKQEQAASDSGSPFYPQRLLNGMLSLNLTEGVRAAAYTLLVEARDHVGQKVAEARERFVVEK